MNEAGVIVWNPVRDAAIEQWSAVWMGLSALVGKPREVVQVTGCHVRVFYAKTGRTAFDSETDDIRPTTVEAGKRLAQLVMVAMVSAVHGAVEDGEDEDEGRRGGRARRRPPAPLEAA